MNDMTKFKFDKVSGKYSFTSASGKIYSSANLKYIEYQFKINGGSADTSIENDIEEKVEQFGINQRFEFISNFVSMVADKLQPSVIISGSGGLGKSVTAVKTLKAEGYVDVTNIENFIEGERLPSKHFKIVKGYSTPKALYRLLYENKDSILVLDDIDSVLTDPIASNLLKGALDSNGERIISWNAEKAFGEDDLPRSFRFTGGVVFITNLHKDKIPQALRTRSVCVDVTMTLAEKLERMEYIVSSEDFEPNISTSIKKIAMELVKKNAERAKELSMRSLLQVMKIAQKFTGEKLENLAKYALTN